MQTSEFIKSIILLPLTARNEKKRTYCCRGYGVAKPLDMNAKAKQGLLALHQLGFDLKKLRNIVAVQEKTLKGRLQGAKKKAESISQQVKHALRDTMTILSDATEKASKKLGELEGVMRLHFIFWGAEWSLHGEEWVLVNIMKCSQRMLHDQTNKSYIENIFCSP